MARFFSRNTPDPLATVTAKQKRLITRTSVHPTVAKATQQALSLLCFSAVILGVLAQAYVAWVVLTS